MLTSKRGLTAATLFATTALFAAPAMASETLTLTDSALAEVPVSVELPAEEVAPLANPFISQATRADVEIATADAGTLAIARASQGVDYGIESLAGEEEVPSEIEISGNVALVSDYRFRGISFSDGDPALQGGIDIAHSSGLYVGTWASTISGGSPYGEMELDIYGGWSGEVSDGVSVDVGLLYYIYPTENELANFLGVDTDYFEPYASISGSLGPVSATLGAAYAWKQNSVGNGSEDNIYIYTDFETAIPNTPLTLTAHLGYNDGPFSVATADNTQFDWGIGASYAVTDSLSLGVNYVDTQGAKVEDFSDAGIFFTIGYSM
ncbi:MAG: TorF family putative porin [Pontixanthobacter sp.]